MKGVSLGYQQVLVSDYDEPRPGPRDALVRVKASAICRADLSLYHGLSVFNKPPTGTIIAGHEPCGVVEAVGEEVTHLERGQRVTVFLAVGCGACRACLAGFWQNCPTWQCLGFDRHGGDAEYLVVPAINCLPIPDDWSFAQGALATDSIGTLYQAQKRLNVRGSDVVAIFGLGPMGTAGLLVAKALGATVIGVDLLDERLERARKLGADEVVNARATATGEALRRLTAGLGPTVALDTSGSARAISDMLDVVAPFGRVGFVGACTEVTINPRQQFIRKHLTAVGSWYFNISDWTEIRDFIVRKRLPVEELITHQFTLDEAKDAFELFDRQETGKVIFLPGGNGTA